MQISAVEGQDSNVSQDHQDVPKEKTRFQLVTERLTKEQISEAREVFQLFDRDNHGEIGPRELGFALAQLGQHPSEEELDAMIAEFDEDGDGVVDFEEFLVMMDQLGWNDTDSATDATKFVISFYGQASIVRWMTDDNIDGTTGDVTGSRIPSVTRFCRRVVLLREVETMIYVCILTAAIVSGLQSYKVNSPFEDALWCHVVDNVILSIFTVELTAKLLAENKGHLHHFFWDHWNTFDFIICTLLIVTLLMRLSNTVAPFRLVRLLRAIRLLQTVRLFPNLTIVVETTIKSASSVVFIGMFGLLFTYMFAIVGVASFGENDPFYFGDLARALLTLFRTLSMDSWSMIMYYNIWGCGQPNFDGNGGTRGYGDYKTETGMECNYKPNGFFAAIYFVTYIAFCAFLILNLFIGIITTEMQEAKNEATKKRKVQNKLALATRLRSRQAEKPSNSGDAEDPQGGKTLLMSSGKAAFENPMANELQETFEDEVRE